MPAPLVTDHALALGPTSGARDALSDEDHSEDEEEDGHHRGIVVAQPDLPAIKDLS